jgi:tetratricopeptide (TPR) repeat protein
VPLTGEAAPFGQRGDHAQARTLLEESLAVRRRGGDTLSVAVALKDLATLLHEQGDEERALAGYREALALCGPAGYARTIAQCLEGVAAIAAAWGQPERAARLSLSQMICPQTATYPWPNRTADSDNGYSGGTTRAR